MSLSRFERFASGYGFLLLGAVLDGVALGFAIWCHVETADARPLGVLAAMWFIWLNLSRGELLVAQRQTARALAQTQRIQDLYELLVRLDEERRP